MDTGDTAWILASSALVLLMTPGLAFFYGGMVRSKTVLNMMMMSFVALAIVPVLWVLYGYSLPSALTATSSSAASSASASTRQPSRRPTGRSPSTSSWCSS